MRAPPPRRKAPVQNSAQPNKLRPTRTIIPPPKPSKAPGGGQGPQEETPASKRLTGPEYAELYVQAHPQYDRILASLREGVSIPTISAHYFQCGLVGVTQSTFEVYLQQFCVRNPGLISQPEQGSFEALIGVAGNSPSLSVLTEVDKAIRLQKLRIAKLAREELQNSNSNYRANTVNEMKLLTQLLELKGKLDGTMTGTGASGSVLVDYDTNAVLSSLEKQNKEQSRMSTLLGNLLNAAKPLVDTTA